MGSASFSSRRSSISDTNQVHMSPSNELSHHDDGAWIEDPIQRQSIILQACQRGSVEYLYPILECFEEHPHPQDLSVGDMLCIAEQARNHPIIDFLRKYAEQNGIEIDPSQRNAYLDADFPVFGLSLKVDIKIGNDMETSGHEYRTRHPTFLCSAA